MGNCGVSQRELERTCYRIWSRIGRLGRESKESEFALDWTLLEKEGISMFGCVMGCTITMFLVCA